MSEALARIWRSRAARRSIVAYALITLLLWPVPLLNVLHAESCAALAAAGFIIAGLATIRLLAEDHRFRAVVTWQVSLLGLPLLLMSVSVLWAPNCSYGTGLLFFVLFPGVSVLLASSLAFLLHTLGLKRPGLVFLGVSLAVSGVTPVYDLGLFPQLYTYNHVFGGVLGPIYDEVLAIRPGLFAFRGLSLLWAATLWLLGRIVSGNRGLRHPLVPWAAIASLGLVAAYSQSGRLGWNTTSEIIADALGRTLTTEHFQIHYDDRSFVRNELHEIADEMEYRYRVLSSLLETEVGEPIRVYLYPTERVKGDVTGSRSTSVAPVWLRHPQVHMLRTRVDRSFDHELVHVFAREFGMPVVKASPSVGLVEGLAAALEAPDGQPSSAALMEAVIQGGSEDSVSVVRDVARALGAFGFWTGRGAVSYSATGSFVRYLLGEYGVEAVKTAYRTGRLSRAFGKSVEGLVAEWYSAVRRGERVSTAALPMAEARFSVPSLFEVECPHTLPGYVAAYRNGVDYMSVHDTTEASLSFEESLSLNRGYLPSAVRLASIKLRRGDFGRVLSMLGADTVAMQYPQGAMLAAEAYAMAGHTEQAFRSLESVEESTPSYAVELRLVLWLIRRVAADTLAARWYFDGPVSLSAPPSVTADPLAALHRAWRAMARGSDVAACDALSDLPPDADQHFDMEDRARYAAQTLLWRAEACAATRPAVAFEAGTLAASLFAEAAEPDLSRLAADRAAFARWKLSQTEGRTTPTSTPPSPDPRSL